jgi:hypothetical protein
MRPPEPIRNQPAPDRPEVQRLQGDAGNRVVAKLLSSGGTPLPETERAFFEPRFGADFGAVRLHTDARAEEAGKSLGAKAFTAGHDIAFGRGQYATGSPEGQRLLAHELTHVVQQGSAAAAVQRQADPAAPDPLESLANDLVSAIQSPLAERTLEPPKSPKAPKTTPQLVFKQQWPAIRKWIVSQQFGGKKAPVPPKGFDGLADQTITDRLGPLSKEDRTTVANRVFDLLVPDVGSETAETYREEFDRLSPRVKAAMEPSADPIVGYVAMRDALKDTFGSIDALNAYFDALVEANFPPVATKVVGQQSLVHIDLKSALDRAATLLKTKGAGIFDAAVASISGFDTLGGKKHHRGSWSTNIRENRNRPSQIGNHSFGFAIDINADLNPNLPEFRWDLVQRLTGFDVKGPDVKGVRPGQDYDVALQSARRFKEASDRFRDMFDTEASFQKALSNEAVRAGMPVPSAELFQAVVAASQAGKSGGEGLMALKVLLLQAMKTEDARKAQGASRGGFGDSGTSIQIAAHEDPVVVSTIVASLKAKIGTRADLERLMPPIRRQLIDMMSQAPPTDKHPELAILFSRSVVADLRRVPAYIREYEMPDSIRRQLSPGVMVADTTATAALLVQLHRLFTSTRISSGALAAQKVGTSPSLAGVAAHGFMNLMPELVAALTSKEGGNLLWLGSTAGTKDWMHFELSKAPRITPEGDWP